MNITVSGIEDGVLKNVVINTRPQMSMESVRKQVAKEIGVDSCIVQIKQGYFYYRDEDLISDIMDLDTSPFSFEIGNASISIDIQYGSKRICILADSKCKIGQLKKRFSQIMKTTHSSMKVVFALYNDVICNDASSLEEIGVSSYSTIYMCSDLYELSILLPDTTSITLYKHYYMTVDSLVEEIAKRCGVDPLLISLYLQQSSKQISITASALQLFRVFDSSSVQLTVTLTSLQEMAKLINRMEKQGGFVMNAFRGNEESLEMTAYNTEKEVKALIQSAEAQRSHYLTQVTTILKEVNVVSELMDTMLLQLGEIEKIRQEQADLLHQCDLLEECNELIPEVWELIKEVDSIDSTIGVVDGRGDKRNSDIAPELKNDSLFSSVGSYSNTLPSSTKTSSTLLSPPTSPPPTSPSRIIHGSLKTPLSSNSLPNKLNKSPPPISSSPPPIPTRRRSSSPLPPPRSTPPPPPPPRSPPPSLHTSTSSVRSPPPLPSFASSQHTPSLSAERVSSDSEEGITLVKPSQMRERMKLMEEMNSRMKQPPKMKAIDIKQSERDNTMPDLHPSFAPPMRPRKCKNKPLLYVC